MLEEDIGEKGHDFDRLISCNNTIFKLLNVGSTILKMAIHDPLKEHESKGLKK